MCPECVSVYCRTVRQLLSGSLTHAYEVSLYMRLHPDVTASVSFFFFIFSVSCYPPKMNVKTYSCVLSPLCRFTSPTPTTTTNPPLCTAPLSIISLSDTGTTPATCLQQDVCRRLILGYNRWYFISAHLAPFFCNVMSIC